MELGTVGTRNSMKLGTVWNKKKFGTRNSIEQETV